MAEQDTNFEEKDHDQITLTLENGTDLNCDVLAVFPCGEHEYIALLPENAGEDGEVFLYRFVENGEEDIELINIEDDEEFEAVSDAFDEILDEEEFFDMVDDGEDETV